MTSRKESAPWAHTVGIAVPITVLAVCILALARMDALVAGQHQASSWYASPDFFPIVAAALAACGASMQLAKVFRRYTAANIAVAADEIDAGSSRPGLALVGLVAMAIYPGLVAVFGYGSATFLFMFILALMLGVTWRRSFVGAAASALVLYVVFTIAFRVWFPETIWRDSWK